jgi:hypothetical protein
MDIIVRASGERTEQVCIKSCEQQGNVHVIRAYPFGESIRQTYKKAMEFNQEWTPVIDADVVLYKNSIQKGLSEATIPQNIFCIDGRTDDKIMMKKRRAGVHIYRTALLEKALKFVDDLQLKPESHVRNQMDRLGFPTFSGATSFGRHDFDQYYRDLWRKSFCQTRKLKNMIKDRPHVWKSLSLTDLDYSVILEAHLCGIKYQGDIIIDARIDYGAEEGLRRLRLTEKRPMNEAI